MEYKEQTTKPTGPETGKWRRLNISKKIMVIFVLMIIIAGVVFAGTKYQDQSRLNAPKSIFRNFLTSLQAGDIDNAYRLLAKDIEPKTSKKALIVIRENAQQLLQAGYEITSVKFTDEKNQPKKVEIIARFKLGDAPELNFVLEEQNNEWKIVKYVFLSGQST